VSTLSGLPGRAIYPGDEAFDQARRPWNVSVEQPVLAVVEAADADDVSALLRYARSAGATVTVQPSGHGASGNTDGTILLRTGLLNQVEVDASRRTVRVGAGVRAGDAQEAANAHGLTGLPGGSPVVSVTGYTLGGGLSWFGRKYGWAAAHVTAFEVVTAAGERARVTADSDPDLFWALRGGGGDFAVVTSMEYRLHAEPVLFGGRMVWPAAQASRVLATFVEVTATAPEELTLWANLVQLPNTPALVTIDATYLGDEAQARDLMRAFDLIEGLASDSRAVMPFTQIGAITAEPVNPSPSLGRGELLTGLDDDAIKALLAEPIDPLLNVQIRHGGGALSGEPGIPPGPLAEQYGLIALGAPLNAEVAAAIRVRQAELVASLGDRVTGRRVLNLLGPGDSAAAAFPPQALDRLRRIKRERDPDGTIRSNFPVLD
jgi:FAD/FMN-containing dehydrogenase